MPTRRLRDRSTGDLLVLLIAGTVCFAVIATGATIVVVEIINPKVDTTLASRQISDILNTLIGLLAGFLAGRTDLNAQRRQDRQQRKDGEP
jgi:hypothetical protein